MDVVRDKDRAVCAEEGEGRFETAAEADAGDYDWFLIN